MNADHLPDESPIRSLGPPTVCARAVTIVRSAAGLAADDEQAARLSFRGRAST